MYDVSKLNRAAAKLASNHQTVAVAESVTAGLIQNAFSAAEQATAFFEGGITAYNFSQKCTHLFIDPVHAIECNCVSLQVAEQMAVGVSKSFNSSWGVGITGYSSPVPELRVEQLYACVSLCYAGKTIISKVINAEKDAPQKVQEFYRDMLINLLAEYWLTLPLLGHDTA